MNNMATEVSYVSILANEHEQRHNFSILPTIKVNATFHVKCSTDEKITVNTTVFDKCAQQSLPRMIDCTFWEPEGTS
jgi:hypothetical protein